MISRLLCSAFLFFVVAGCQQPQLSNQEKRRLQSLALSALKEPSDPSNRHAGNADAQHLGEMLFFDSRLSKDDTVSCATCHIPERGFTDGLRRATFQFDPKSDHPLLRNTPTVTGSAWQTWQYWDGRRDSLWSQALTPMEAPVEMASTRVAVARLLASDNTYRSIYEKVFGPLPIRPGTPVIDATPMGSPEQKRRWYKLPKPQQTQINQVFANAGKALAAYQSTLRPAQTKFDRFVTKLANGEPYRGELSDLEYKGARLFINEKKTQCLECHNGPLLSNGDFHNIGSATLTGDNPDFGRMLGVQSVMIDEFNCQGRFSDATADDCLHLNFMNRNDFAHTHGSFRTPSLRNAANTAPYFHDGRFDSLEQVINHYVTTANSDKQTELRKFPLDDNEVRALVAFINTLSTE